MLRCCRSIVILVVVFSFSIINSFRCARFHATRSNKFSTAKYTMRASNNEGFDIKAWFNPNTRGGVLVWAGLLTLIPIGANNILVSKGLEPSSVGAYVGAIFVLLTNLLWASTYVFRVANKDMTYAKQLRDYENAVLQKRLDELGEQEVQTLLEEIENDKTS